MVPILFQNGHQMPTIFAEKVIFFLLFLWCSLSDFDHLGIEQIYVGVIWKIDMSMPFVVISTNRKVISKIFTGLKI
jgi:hypothetical protein